MQRSQGQNSVGLVGSRALAGAAGCGGRVLTVDGTGTLPSLFSPLSSPDIPFSFLYFPSLPQAEFTALYGDGALEEARRLREGNWASVRTVLTGAVALGALVTVGAFFASK